MIENLYLKCVYHIKCYDKNRVLKWEDEAPNLITTEGLNYSVDIGLLAGTQLTGWNVLLTDGTPTVAAADTMSSHSGWVEITAYTGSRPTWTGVRTLLVATNSAAIASFAITGTATVGGAGLTSDATGTAGKLFSVAAFTGGDKSVANGDTVEVTYSITIADA